MDERDKLIFPHDDARKPGIYLPRICFEEKLLFVSSREQAEADIRIRGMLKTIRDARRVPKDDEALFRLDQFRGLLRLYEPAKIPSLKYVVSELTPSVERRLVQLLDEAELIEMSEHRSRTFFLTLAVSGLLGYVRLRPGEVGIRLTLFNVYIRGIPFGSIFLSLSFLHQCCLYLIQSHPDRLST